MSVKFVFDEFNLSSHDDFDIIITSNLSSVSAARTQIVQFLSNDNSSQLSVLLKSHAVLKRIDDLLTTKGVEPLQILNPRQLLSAKLGFQPPVWLYDSAIAKLNLLTRDKLKIDQLFFLRDLLRACNFELFGMTTFEKLMLFISSQPDMFSLFLGFTPFKEELKRYLELELNVKKSTAIELVDMFDTNIDLIDCLHLISHNQAVFLLKKIANENKIAFASPPLEVSNSIACLPLINLYSNDSDLETKFIDILEALIKFSSPEDTASEIQKLAIHPWPKLLQAIERAIRKNPKLNSKGLIERLQTIENSDSIELAATLQSMVNLGSLDPLDKGADIKTVVDWSYKYFEQIRIEFEAESLEYETELAKSFGDWLISQTSRVEKSQYDWRQVSESIKESLAQDHITVVFMVDALSQIHHKACEEILNTIDNLSFQANLVFAPLPTITKIGKKSVLSGLLPSKTSGSDLDLLVSQYGSTNLTSDNILILQDWKRASSNQLSNKTKLAVVFINELDDRLHKTSTFNKHANDARTIIKSIRKTIEKWLQISYSLGKEISFYVTADHGVTSLNRKVPNSFNGKVGERVVELTTKPENIPSDFYYLPSYKSSAGYIVPRLRASFDKECALSHGGLTPEEVLIPFIKLSTVSNSHKQNVFDIDTDILDCKIVADKEWKLQITLKVNCNLSNLHLKAIPPFFGQANVINASKSDLLNIPLSLTSKHSQEGHTEITIACRYEKDSQQIEKNLDFVVDIPKPLLKQTESSKNFGAMFDL
ncbi:PglZ domain-containing protein [Aliiglaciecola sp. NS0011-25]|uniref:PglZ domain-containing protein n=1 Tax=Aliiglaciecola sp. NS0011-25 TaxID=3127654 RepID=UPI0031084922